MNHLKIRFIVRFEDYHIDFCPNGPLTHRWLPDGENDFIPLNVGHSDYELKIWFKRRGKTESGAIRFTLNDFEVDPDAMSRQAVLDAGPLTSELIVKNIEQEKYDAVVNTAKNDHYVKFAKEIIRVVIPPLNNFLRLIRFKHGQYWIREINDFDSQRGSLGSFCNMLQMKWSNDDGKNWNDFHPTELMQRAKVYMGDKQSYIQDYLTKMDWDSRVENIDKSHNNSW